MKDPYKVSIKDICTSQNTILNTCNELVNHYKSNKSKLILDFNDCNFLYPDYALLLLCTLKYIDSSLCKISGNILISKESQIASYLTRMRFFEILDIPLTYDFNITHEKSSVQIQKYTSENQLDVLKKILTVLKEKSDMDEDVYTSLDYCFNEVLDNVLNHSEQNEGWVVAQYFGNLNSIRLMVADSGIGIYQSLHKKYNYSEEEALSNCVVEGISNGKGQGHGLYATSSFIRLNKGWMSIISGNKRLNITEEKAHIKDIAHWKGTCIYLRINTNVPVDYKSFTSKNYDYKKQLFEDMFDNESDKT
jgi:anti-sigma regulatory factor (Ser/Thr protein kinase)